ncbi:hypothetical protein D9X30_1858 [Cupriavidus sp. U2]|uniref:PAAR domain-containing protein n=1 Tax=Cupriavidus sp. U2 TaxID=2920269 RepID=UPI00129E0D26|nr:PAAR domain-containing protein [Cupriavidus sp. U2]KAI3592987.1 hypothetical protein D9X30_1858 [Cupriavidus sp. U2]
MNHPVLLGDPTSHGGCVKTATSTFNIDGRRAALVGDLVSCPKHGDNPIVEGGTGYRENGRKLAVHGCRSECGSVMMAASSGATIE